MSLLTQPPFWGGLVLGGLAGGVAGYLAFAYLRFDPGRSDTWGRFSSTPRVELLDDGRLLRLTEDFAYVDARGKVWAAEKDSIVDGASIPRVFWTMVGGPLEGKYRNASIVHDVGCDRMAEPWQDVHRMFYEACRCGGVDQRPAMILYGAVFHFGPRWEIAREVRMHRTPTGEETPVPVEAGVRIERARVQAPDEAWQKLAEFVDRENPTLEQIETLDMAAFTGQ